MPYEEDARTTGEPASMPAYPHLQGYQEVPVPIPVQQQQQQLVPPINILSDSDWFSMWESMEIKAQQRINDILYSRLFMGGVCAVGVLIGIGDGSKYVCGYKSSGRQIIETQLGMFGVAPYALIVAGAGGLIFGNTRNNLKRWEELREMFTAAKLDVAVFTDAADDLAAQQHRNTEHIKRLTRVLVMLGDETAYNYLMQDNVILQQPRARINNLRSERDSKIYCEYMQKHGRGDANRKTAPAQVEKLYTYSKFVDLICPFASSPSAYQ